MHSFHSFIQLIHSISQSVSQSLVLWFTASLSRWFIDSLDRSLIGSLMHRFLCSLSHWFIESLNHWLIGLLLLWFNDLLICWFADSSIHWFIDPLNHDSLVHSVNCAWILSFHCHLSNHLLICWCTSQLQHFMASASQKLSYSPLISYSHVLFSKLPPRRRPGTTWHTAHVSAPKKRTLQPLKQLHNIMQHCLLIWWPWLTWKMRSLSPMDVHVVGWVIRPVRSCWCKTQEGLKADRTPQWLPTGRPITCLRDSSD